MRPARRRKSRRPRRGWRGSNSIHSNGSWLSTLTSSWEPGVSFLLIEVGQAQSERIVVTEDSLTVELVDGRTLTVPLAWYPRLAHGSVTERANYRLIGRGEGIHWPDL